jgi:predicted N-acetyltransferase YhbS
MIIERNLQRDEIEQIWTIDRSEVIDHVYHFEDGALVLKPEHYDMRGWPPGEAATYTPLLIECFDRDGWFCGVFDDARLVAVAVLDSKPIGANHDQLQLKFLHVSNGYRGRGLGRRLFELAQDEARARGARRLYISATPSENTIDFYLRRGCVLTPEPEPELLALEPEDIHLECDLAQ